MDTFMQIVNRYASSIAIGFTGGEPLFHPRLFDMIRIAHERRMKVHIPTNGTALLAHVDEFLEAPVELLNVSFYGTDAESFARFTGVRANFFDDILKAIAELAARRRPGSYPHILRGSFICTKKNMHRVVDFVRLCENLGIDQVKLKNLNFFAIPGFEESMCLYEDDPEVQNFIEHLRRTRFRIPVFLPRLYRRDYKIRGCNMPFRLLSIDGDGFIGPCCVEGTDKRWDNFYENPEVWNGPTMSIKRRDLLDSTYPLPLTCLHCEEMILDSPSISGR
jgi:MoaA/NifB/PqqE/SkfB family radical SAM enzyme